MSIKRTALAVAALAPLVALSAPASAATSYTYGAANCLTAAEDTVDVRLEVVGDKIKVTPVTPIDISQFAPFTADDELEWVVKSRYRDGGVRRDVVESR